ncbi:hypothetical protein H311_01686 [Anncaliia algerae PRA109]|nr:hypothetical protein H311_01686 [Anncaliia algerae PRA109]
MVYIDVLREPCNERSMVLLSEENAIQYLIESGRLSVNKKCAKCEDSMKIINSNNHLNKKIYYCRNRECRFSKPIFYGLRINTPRIPISTYLLAVYKWIENVYEKDILRNLNISKASYQKIKSHLLNFSQEQNSYLEKEKLGGLNKKVQVDETAIFHGKLDKCPSNTADETPGLIWLVGLIEPETGKIHLENRSSITMINIFRKYIHNGTTVVTDGFRSYPSAVASIEGIHIIVNHSLGFRNRDGFHTNNIENLWSILKYEIKKRRGILRSNIEIFLNEFKMKYNLSRKRTSDEIFYLWNVLVDYLFKDE